MARVKLPSQVPLPEIPRYTEDIVFGGLGLPVGFDQERLTVNLVKIDRFRKVAGLATISVLAETGQTEEAEPQVTSVDEHGTATMGFAGKRTKKPLASRSLQWPIPESRTVGRPSAVIKVNNTELETRIEEKPKKYKKGAFDVPGRAAFLNKAVKEGLKEASLEASFNKQSMIISGLSYSMGSALAAIDVFSTAALLMYGPVGNTMLAGWNALRYASDNPEAKLQAFKEHRHSLVYGFTPDRYIAAQGILAGRQLIKSRS